MSGHPPNAVTHNTAVSVSAGNNNHRLHASPLTHTHAYTPHTGLMRPRKRTNRGETASHQIPTTITTQDTTNTTEPRPTNTPFARRSRAQLEEYIHAPTTYRPRKTSVSGKRKGKVREWAGGAEEATRTTEAREEETHRSGRPPAHTTHSHHTTIHTQRTSHRIITLNPPSSDSEEVRGTRKGRLPATPEPEATTHNSTLPHNAPAPHAPSTSLDTPRGRRDPGASLQGPEDTHTQHK